MNRARQLVKAAMARLLPRRAFVLGGRREDGICLTFDDGPHPQHTPRVLDALAEAGMKATFFMVGKRAEQHPEIVRRVAREGHAIGNHTYSHRPPDEVDARRLVTETARTAAVLESILGEASVLFRPPHGKLTATKLAALWGLGQTIVLWTLDPKDFRARSAGEVLAYFDQYPPRGGDILLFHDTLPHTATVVRSLARTTADRGLRCETVSEMIAG